MNHKLLIILLFALAALTGNYVFKSFLSTDNIIGTYVNKNYSETHSTADIPNVADTLVLYKDGHFTSGYWGTGKFKISYSASGTCIDLSYKYESGNAGFETFIKRQYFTGTKIVLNEDLEQYYEKVR